MKPIDVKYNTYINIDKEVNDKDPKFKVGDHVRISKHKSLFAKGYTANFEEIFVAKKVKNTVPWTYVVNDLNGEKIIGTFYEKELQKVNQKEFRIEKVVNKKGNKLYVNWKGYDNSFNSWIDKKDLVEMSQYFPKPYQPIGGDINVKVDLSNYAAKTDLKNVTHVEVSSFSLISNLASLKTVVDKLFIDKFTPVPNDLEKLSNVVKNDVVKKTVYDKLVAKVNNINTTGFDLKTTYDTDKSDLEKKISDADKKIPDTSDLAKKANLNAKITEVENKIIRQILIDYKVLIKRLPQIKQSIRLLKLN